MALERMPVLDSYQPMTLNLGAALREEFATAEPAPPRLMKLLAQLDERIEANEKRERCYAAVDRAVTELVGLCRPNRTDPGVARAARNFGADRGGGERGRPPLLGASQRGATPAPIETSYQRRES
jgi:hypothetical protein